MSHEGPALDALTRRLAECPAVFLADGVDVEAVVFDLAIDLGGATRPAPPFAAEVRPLALVAAWLLHDPWFRSARRYAAPALAWLRDGLGELARLVPAEQFVHDPERREELARACLAALRLRPRGETEAQAADRLRTIDTVARERVVAEMRVKEQRARELREAMRRKQAEEAAARWSPE
jgi:hypothetical protein